MHGFWVPLCTKPTCLSLQICKLCCLSQELPVQKAPDHQQRLYDFWWALFGIMTMFHAQS